MGEIGVSPEAGMRTRLRVTVHGPRPLIRQGLVSLLRGQPNMIAGDGTDAADASRDVTLWDAAGRGPPSHSLPSPCLVLLSGSHAVRSWLDRGASGCILDSASVEELLSALRQVARGEEYISPQIAHQMVALLGRESGPLIDPVEPITDRERDVLGLLAQGLSNKDMAQKLYLSVRTVEGHLASIYAKLGVGSRIEAVLWALRSQAARKTGSFADAPAPSRWYI